MVCNSSQVHQHPNIMIVTFISFINPGQLDDESREIKDRIEWPSVFRSIERNEVD